MLPHWETETSAQVNTPSLCPRGLNMQRVLLGTPIHPISGCTHMGSRVSVDTENPATLPLLQLNSSTFQLSQAHSSPAFLSHPTHSFSPSLEQGLLRGQVT